MPAPSSSPTDPAVGHLAGLAEGADGPLGVLAMLARVADPRHRRGVRHRLAVIFGGSQGKPKRGNALVRGALTGRDVTIRVNSVAVR